MGLTLHLGVVDIPHPTGGQSTGDIAGYIEARYHLMEVFIEETGGVQAVALALEQSAADAIQSMMLGSNSAGITLTAQAETDIETEFRQFLTLQKFDGVIPGVPTAAALKGVSHRFAKPNAKSNPSRPSFVDTGTYSAAFRCWTETN